MKSTHYPSRAAYTVVSALGYMLDGYDLSVISVFTFSLLKFGFFKYNSLELGFVSGAALLGAMFGALIFGHFSDRLGRRYLYTFDLLFFVVFAALSAFSTNIIQMIIYRFFVGWGVGADYALSPVYATEMYPTNKRGMGYGWVWTFWSVGAFIAFILGYVFYLVDPVYGWRWALGIGAIIALATIIVRSLMPESSRWKVAVKQDTNAVEEARRLSQVTGMSDQDISKLVEVEAKKLAHVKPGSFLELFKGDYAKRTAIVWTQWILYDIGSYGFGLYAPSIISMLGFKGASSMLLSALLYIPGALGALGAAFLNDRWGRRILQLLGFGFSTLGMVLVALGALIGGLMAMVIGVIGLVLWYGFGNLGPGNTMGLYAIELFPTKLRSTSMGSATAITRFVSFLSAFEFPYIALVFGKLSFFEFLAAITFVAFIFTIFFTPETKGISLEDIATAKYKGPGLHPRLEVE
ncbi:MFS transporter [Caldivirga maquilingensis]|uniref:General substrate transporter n=1 Tax=Caldivirga maquilingensis (strain ATCC 700844 / DSM 13496 / JCM 10307 / IC-167) TaxID=397948 RepID=A8MCP2_CALMQ|nr:MFS transporter [Caldivirga maquilingensis]ABW01548.1 General substrate transporter [Caldivirga maquilingensis IC-167]